MYVGYVQILDTKPSRFGIRGDPGAIAPWVLRDSCTLHSLLCTEIWKPSV